jgi:hypothetical protein
MELLYLKGNYCSIVSGVLQILVAMFEIVDESFVEFSICLKTPDDFFEQPSSHCWTLFTESAN